MTRDMRGLGGILFAVFFTVGDVLLAFLATTALPLPTAPASAVVAYFQANPAAVWSVAVVQLLASIALLVFVPAAARRLEPGWQRTTASIGGFVAGAALIVCAVLSGVLAIGAAGGWSLDVIDGLRTANFLSGGAVHVVTLGVFVGALSLAAGFPKGIRWFGYLAATPAVLGILSLFFYYANVFLPVGRTLGMIWCVAAGIALLVGTRRR
ncbi:hypothetical protein [Fodinicola acaciae]|uniref:hypothetical protein n=1 Tax=Fodinicola acaciae TaxID=2681555 RepID=UPI0013D1BC19|nr:hypothetical protein [Fodinicola acaciae]